MTQKEDDINPLTVNTIFGSFIPGLKIPGIFGIGCFCMVPFHPVHPMPVLIYLTYLFYVFYCLSNVWLSFIYCIFTLSYLFIYVCNDLFIIFICLSLQSQFDKSICCQLMLVCLSLFIYLS